MLVNINLGPAESQRIDIAMKISNSATTVDVSVAAPSFPPSVGVATPLQKSQNLEADLQAYLAQLATLQGGNGATITVDGFTGGNLPSLAQTARIEPQPAQSQQEQGVTRDGLSAGQGQRAAAAGGARAGGGAGRGSASGIYQIGGAAAAPPPPPPVSAPVRIIPDNPTVFGGATYNYDRVSPPNTANYAPITDNPFRRVSQ